MKRLVSVPTVIAGYVLAVIGIAYAIGWATMRLLP